tara:strand:+ start:1771 stop:2592 length:822 start_codon:yes stop_codon:yes gene_type:complete
MLGLDKTFNFLYNVTTRFTLTRRRHKEQKDYQKKKRRLETISPPEPKKIFHKKTVEAKSQNQQDYLDAMDEQELICCIGPAGSGKTYLAVATALLGMKSGRYKKIVITRPLVQADEDSGSLPGDLMKKLEPYLRPMYNEMNHFITPEIVKEWLRTKQLEIVPLGYMRGWNFHNTFVLADESQNATYKQLKLLITRLGRRSTMVLTGDYTQSDLHPSKQGGIYKMAKHVVPNVEDATVVELTFADIQRGKLVANFLKACEDYENETRTQQGASP